MSTGHPALDRIDYILCLYDQYFSNVNDNDYGLALPVLTVQSVSKEIMDFNKSYTKKSDFEIIQRTVSFREKALKSFEYGCIRGGKFINPPIITHPKWKSDIKSMLQETNTRILDIGCCFGTDIRYCVHLGCASEQCLGVDISDDFIELGFDYFGDRESLKNRFVVMDVLKNNGKNFVDTALKLNDNKQFHIIQIANVYHLLTEEEGEVMMKLAVSLIDKSNGIIFGKMNGCVNGFEGESYRKDKLRYLHSEQSFQRLMERCGKFENISIDSRPLPSNVSKKLLDKFGTPERALRLNFFGRFMR